jgi:glycosyltransferase involved in cell wall biosynthesis
MESKQDTLVILSPGFPKDETDTTCVPPQQLFVKALKEICPGLNIIVISFHYPFISAEYEWRGIKVIALGGKDKGQLHRLATWTKVWFVLNKLNKEHQLIGLLSFWFGECAFVGDYYARTHKLSHYSWLLGQDAKKGNKYFKWIKPKGDSLIALSDFLARETKKNYKIMPANVIPVGIDASLFPVETIKRDIDILGVGSLIPLKQYNIFIEAIAAIKDFFPDVKTVICGKGPELENLQALAAMYNLDNNISFVGELSHTGVLALMQRSRVFLHTSKYEGYGAVLSEALYAGAHVVSFCKPMDKDYRHHHIVKDKEQINLELLSILKNSRPGHDRVLTNSIQQVAKNMISLFAD